VLRGREGVALTNAPRPLQQPLGPAATHPHPGSETPIARPAFHGRERARMLLLLRMIHCPAINAPAVWPGDPGCVSRSGGRAGVQNQMREGAGFLEHYEREQCNGPQVAPDAGPPVCSRRETAAADQGNIGNRRFLWGGGVRGRTIFGLISPPPRGRMGSRYRRQRALQHFIFFLADYSFLSPWRQAARASSGSLSKH
jgi:hypothetical protein